VENRDRVADFSNWSARLAILSSPSVHTANAGYASQFRVHEAVTTPCVTASNPITSLEPERPYPSSSEQRRVHEPQLRLPAGTY
jgi:hypothetical protein